MMTPWQGTARLMKRTQTAGRNRIKERPHQNVAESQNHLADHPVEASVERFRQHAFKGNLSQEAEAGSSSVRNCSGLKKKPQNALANIGKHENDPRRKRKWQNEQGDRQ